MKDKPNRHAGVCQHCAASVPAGEGVLKRKQAADGSVGWRVVHREGECQATRQAMPSSVEPYWFVPGRGLTPGGLEVDGMSIAHGAHQPAGGIPGNDSARAIAERGAAPAVARPGATAPFTDASEEF